MSKLAMEIGRPLLFPVRCRYCQQNPIYLFADPDGGFAIFDTVGKPWPKHSCGNGTEDPSSYDVSSVSSANYDLPVPPHTPRADYEPHKHLRGTVVKVSDYNSARGRNLYQVALYTGHAVYTALCKKRLPLGRFVMGYAKPIEDVGTCLVDVRILRLGFRTRLPRKKKAKLRRFVRSL